MIRWKDKSRGVPENPSEAQTKAAFETLSQAMKDDPCYDRLVRQRPKRDWIVGTDGVVALRQENLDRIVDATLPTMNTFVEVLMFDGNTFVARRIDGFESGCGWIWETATGWLIPGHPLLMCWRPLEV